MKNQSNRAMILGNASPLPSNAALALETADTFRNAVPAPPALFANGVVRTAGSYGYRDRVDTPGDTFYSDVMAFDLRVDGIDPAGDATFPELLFAPPVAAIQYHFNGTSFDRVQAASAANVATQPIVGAQLVTQPGNFSINADPGSNAQATVSRAAGAAGVRHIITAIHGTVLGFAAAAEVSSVLLLRNGASGVGPILWSARVLVGPSTNAIISISGLSIVGSAATIITLEFSAASGLSTQQNISLNGYDIG